MLTRGNFWGLIRLSALRPIISARLWRRSRGPADYVAIGPIYQTTSKENPDPLVEWEELKPSVKQVTKPLVAIGGITAENAGRLFDLGVDSVAVIRDLLMRRGYCLQDSGICFGLAGTPIGITWPQDSVTAHAAKMSPVTYLAGLFF